MFTANCATAALPGKVVNFDFKFSIYELYKELLNKICPKAVMLI